VHCVNRKYSYVFPPGYVGFTEAPFSSRNRTVSTRLALRENSKKGVSDIIYHGYQHSRSYFEPLVNQHLDQLKSALLKEIECGMYADINLMQKREGWKFQSCCKSELQPRAYRSTLKSSKLPRVFAPRYVSTRRQLSASSTK